MPLNKELDKLITVKDICNKKTENEKKTYNGKKETKNNLNNKAIKVYLTKTLLKKIDKYRRRKPVSVFIREKLIEYFKNK